jgi:hypothetical protein
MNYIMLISGIVILILITLDFMYTTLSTNGVGLISGPITTSIWRILLWSSRGKGKNKILNFSGVICILTILTVWILFLWLGNTLIFASDPTSILHTQTHVPATIAEKFYYVGYTLSTLGMGDFYASTSFWKIFTIIISLSGLSGLTIAITYLTQVITSELNKRQLSIYIASLGGTPQHILYNGWNGKDFRKLEADFTALTSLIISHSQHHLSYPVLHYFHSTNLREATALTIPALDEALTILLLFAPPELRPDNLHMETLRNALTHYLLTLENDFIVPATNPLPLPDLSLLASAGVPLLPWNDQIDQAYEKLAKRRKLLQALLINDGWTFEELFQSKFGNDLDLGDEQSHKSSKIL